MVDFGDGTYGLHLGPNFYRVDALLPLKRDNPSVPHYANLGPGGSIWVSVAEKRNRAGITEDSRISTIRGSLEYRSGHRIYLIWKCAGGNAIHSVVCELHGTSAGSCATFHGAEPTVSHN